MMKWAVRTLGIALLVAGFVLSPWVHSAVPHSHDDGHGQESAVWVQMHSALRHEDKKVIAADAVVPLMVWGVVALVSVCGVRRSRAKDIRNLYRERYLMRGIARYRVFG